MFKALSFLLFLTLAASITPQDANDFSPEQVREGMQEWLSVREYKVPMNGLKIDWEAVRDDFVEHWKKLDQYNTELEQGKTEEEAAVAADLHLGYAGSKSGGWPYLCNWSAKKFSKECGPQNSLGKVLGYSAAEFTLRKWAVFKKGEKEVSFRSACRKHDYCFGRCERSQKVCDDQFAANLARICNSDLTGTMSRCRRACSSVTGMFVKMVRTFGHTFYCQTLIGRNKWYLLMSDKNTADNIMRKCGDRTGTPMAYAENLEEKNLAVSLLRQKRISSVWFDEWSCTKIPCVGSGACAYLSSNGNIYRTNNCEAERNILCETLTYQGKVPHYSKKKMLEEKDDSANLNVESDVLEVRDEYYWNWMMFGAVGAVVAGFGYSVLRLRNKQAKEVSEPLLGA